MCVRAARCCCYVRIACQWCADVALSCTSHDATGTHGPTHASRQRHLQPRALTPGSFQCMQAQVQPHQTSCTGPPAIRAAVAGTSINLTTLAPGCKRGRDTYQQLAAVAARTNDAFGPHQPWKRRSRPPGAPLQASIIAQVPRGAYQHLRKTLTSSAVVARVRRTHPPAEH
jgi:hypothetical protein